MRTLREPSLWFFPAAALLAAGRPKLAGDAGMVAMSEDDSTVLERNFRAQRGRSPTARERAALVQEAVDEEFLWREGLRLGLDRGDAIVRHRIVQKMTFLL